MIRPLMFPLILLLLLAPWLPFAPARAATSFDGCAGFVDALPATISTQGVWCLRRDLASAASSGVALSIDANNVTLDCHGFRIQGQAGSSSTAWGIYASGRQNIVLRNCDVRRFRIGAELRFGTGHVLEHNRFHGNLEVAIMLRSVEGGRVSGNRVGETGGAAAHVAYMGIHCRAVAGGACVLEDNIVSGVVGSTSWNNPVTGIQVSDSRGGRIAGNTVRRLLPSGQGTLAKAIDVSLFEGKHVLVEGNRLDLGTASAGSVGIQCGEIADGIFLRGNTTWGFESPHSVACAGDGSNRVH